MSIRDALTIVTAGRATPLLGIKFRSNIVSQDESQFQLQIRVASSAFGPEAAAQEQYLKGSFDSASHPKRFRRYTTFCSSADGDPRRLLSACLVAAILSKSDRDALSAAAIAVRS